MRARFLERVFERYLLPEAVYDLALDIYGPRYSTFFTFDPRLGARVSRLLDTDTDEDVLHEALWAGNLGALDIILQGPSISQFKVTEILNKWMLSEHDLSRLRSLGMSTRARDRANNVRPGEWRPPESRFIPSYNQKANHQRARDKESRELAGTTLLADMDPTWAYDDDHFAELLQVLANELGDGTTSDSLELWRCFLALMAQGRNQLVTEIVNVAKCLVFST